MNKCIFIITSIVSSSNVIRTNVIFSKVRLPFKVAESASKKLGVKMSLVGKKVELVWASKILIVFFIVLEIS